MSSWKKGIIVGLFLILVIITWYGWQEYLNMQRLHNILPVLAEFGPEGKTKWDDLPYNQRQELLREGRKVFDHMNPEEKDKFREWLIARIMTRLEWELNLNARQEKNIRNILENAIRYRLDTHPELLPPDQREKQFRDTVEAFGNEVRDVLSENQKEKFDNLRKKMRPSEKSNSI